MTIMPGFETLKRLGRSGSLLTLALVVLGGCGARKYPVVGKVVYRDGTPFPGGMVIFSPMDPTNPTGARGYIREDGSFELSTDKEGDGSLEGHYRALVRPPVPGGPEDAARPHLLLIEPRFTKFETSGLEFEVRPGKNEFTLTVDRPARNARK
jgi:hypothetical protein